MKLRPYQTDNKNDIYNAWDSGAKNVLSVNPTGSGKTVIFSDIISDESNASCAIAHRQELVSRISLALARNDIRHRIIGPQKVVRLVVGVHMSECGMSYYDPKAPAAVAGVRTLVRRQDELSAWLQSVKLWVQDEAHHVLKGNEWGKAASMFPNARGLGVTATPCRADGKGLGRHVDGLFDEMVEGPSMRTLIKMGYLTDYRIFAPKTEDLNLTNVTVSKVTGDYNPNQLKIAVRKSHIIGDVVTHYLRIAPGKLGITFVPDVETATDVAAEFNRQGVPAAVVHAKTPDADRIRILREFKARKLMQLVNVDLFGEGFDLPAIEVVSMARPTQSYGLYVQQFGRALRLMLSPIVSGAWDTYSDEQRLKLIAESTKPHAIIIDHVCNVDRHRLPDAPRVWTLDRREKRSKSDDDGVIPVTTCLNPECMSVYERIYNKCPYCGHKPEPAARSGPEFVDGDLLELDPATLAAMRGEVAEVDKDKEEARADAVSRHMPKIGEHTHVKRHVDRQVMQASLRASIAWWAAYQREYGRTDSQSYRLFYFMFGVDALSAQALSKKDANALAGKINKHLGGLT